MSFGLVIAGLVLISSFIRPYLYYFLAPVPLEASYPLNKSEDRIFIPRIKLSAPLLEDMRYSDRAIIRYSYTATPDKKGNVVLAGHNAASHTLSPLLALLHLVDENDGIVLHFRGRRYVYQVTTKTIIRPERIDKYLKQTTDRRLTLITCYPPTSTAMRLIIIAKQADN